MASFRLEIVFMGFTSDKAVLLRRLGLSLLHDSVVSSKTTLQNLDFIHLSSFILFMP